MLILTRHQDNVEAINSTLRNAGHAVRCTWIRELNELGDGLAQINAHMLIAFVGPDPADTSKVMSVCTQFGAEVPVLIAREQVDEEIIASAMHQGARDVVTLKNPVRLQAVVKRELDAHRQARTLNATINSAREYREQLKSFMAGSADAIAHVQEGIVVDANPAWLDLYGLPNADAIVGTPLMDSFDPEAHAAIKGALVACTQGKWSNHSLRATALLSDGSSVPLDIELSPTELDGEPAVRLCVAANKSTSATTLDKNLNEALERDAATGALQRKFFIEQLKRSLAQPIKAGIRQLVSIEADKLAAICEDIGPLGVEEFVGQLAGLVDETRQPSDLFGRFGDGAFMLLMERGTPRDIETWAKNLLRKVGAQVFRIGDKQISCTCSIGIGAIDPRSPDLTASLTDALAARRSAQQGGGNRIQVIDHQDEDTRQLAADEIWVRHIKTALMENRFRLMQQPIASLLGEDRGMFDVLVRMIDETGQELLPSEFMAAAERNDLMKNIDRWIVGASMTFCASRPVKQLFVRLSKDSVRDKSLLQWLSNQLKATRVDPQRIAFQISEQVATEYLADTSDLAAGLRKAGFLFALEHFGTGRDPARLISHLPLDYIKVDGTLMQGLAVDTNLQQRVRELVDQAKNKQVATIAERVEDANTMAVLWQLGVEFIQGYFVNEPEQVVMG
jgi:EAL domain-containing protein (putative c-di-GMP-specific phosphodiesterase class I)/GGDEF domain-containing protein/PAS domain-containing protein